MKHNSKVKLVTTLLALSTLTLPLKSSHAASDPFSFKQTDKQLHMAASYGLSLTGTRFLETKQFPRWEAVLYASLFTLTVGAAKELFIDPAPSGGDMIANLIGTAVSAGVVFTFEF